MIIKTKILKTTFFFIYISPLLHDIIHYTIKRRKAQEEVLHTFSTHIIHKNLKKKSLDKGEGI